jgi:SAM-dependent methyltransferase
MSAKHQLRRRVVAQFSNPTGVGGHVAGWVMGHRRSNLVRNRWAVDLLDPQPAERVLELGCGPGVALAAIAERLVDGAAVGVDHSRVMIGYARRRNADAVAIGRVQLVCARVEDLLPTDSDRQVPGVQVPAFAEPFHAVLAVNSIGFWDEPERHLGALRELMPRGRIALVSQPRCPGATAQASRAAGIELAGLLESAGFTGITSAMLDLDPPVVCVQATTGPP